MEYYGKPKNQDTIRTMYLDYQFYKKDIMDLELNAAISKLIDKGTSGLSALERRKLLQNGNISKCKCSCHKRGGRSIGKN